MTAKQPKKRPPAKKKAAKKATPRKRAAPNVGEMLTREAAPDAHPLTPSHRAFVNEYIKDLNGTCAYMRVHPKAAVSTAATEACRILKNPKVRAAVEARRQKLAAKVSITTEELLTELVTIWRADPTELSQLRRLACEACWPDQNAGRAADPNPECVTCNGEGIERPFFADTRHLSPAARLLFTGVKVTQQGIEVKTHDKMVVAEKIAKIIGGYEIDNKQKGSNAAEALREFFASLHSAGSMRVPIAPAGKQAG